MVSRKHSLALLCLWCIFFFCLRAKVLNLILPSTLGRRGASESATQTPHVTERAWKITLCLLCQKPKRITWSLVGTPFQTTYQFQVMQMPVLSFPFLSLFLSHFTDLILLSGTSLNLLMSFSRQRLARGTHDFRYLPGTIMQTIPCLHKMWLFFTLGGLVTVAARWPVSAEFCSSSL